MSRASMTIAIFLVSLTVAANFFVAAGLAEDWGVAPQPGGDQAVERANDQAQNIEADKGSSSTLFGAFISTAGVLGDIFAVVFAGPLMLINLGIPEFVVTLVFAPQYLVVGADLAFAISGRDI